MDFLTNLIKRPLSVIRTDSTPDDAMAEKATATPAESELLVNLNLTDGNAPKSARLISIDSIDSVVIEAKQLGAIKSCTKTPLPLAAAVACEFPINERSAIYVEDEDERFDDEELMPNPQQASNDNSSEAKVIFKVPLNPIKSIEPSQHLADQSDMEDTFKTAIGDDHSIFDLNVTQAINATLELEAMPVDVDYNEVDEDCKAANEQDSVTVQLSEESTLTEIHTSLAESSTTTESKQPNLSEQNDKINSADGDENTAEQRSHQIEAIKHEEKLNKSPEIAIAENSEVVKHIEPKAYDNCAIETSKSTKNVICSVAAETEVSDAVSSSNFPLKEINTGASFPLSPFSQKMQESPIINEIPELSKNTDLNRTIDMPLKTIADGVDLDSTFDAVSSSDKNFPVEVALPVNNEKRRTFCITLEPSNETTENEYETKEPVASRQEDVNIGSADGTSQLNVTQEPRRTFSMPEIVIQQEFKDNQVNNFLDIGAGGDAGMNSDTFFRPRLTFTLPTPEPMEIDEMPIELDAVEPIEEQTLKSVPLALLKQTRLSFNLMSCDSPVGTKNELSTIQESVGKSAITNTEEAITGQPIESLDKTVCLQNQEASTGRISLGLSAKELSESGKDDEKDVAVIEQQHRIRRSHSTIGTLLPPVAESEVSSNDEQFFDAEPGNANENKIVLNSCDFDFLLSKGNSNTRTDRNSVLLKFDPLLGGPTAPEQQQLEQQAQIEPDNPLQPEQKQQQQQQQQQLLRFSGLETNNSYRCSITPPRSSNDSQFSNNSASGDFIFQDAICKLKERVTKPQNNAKMSVDIIDNDCNKSFENSNNSVADDLQRNYKMDDIEKKFKNEYLKTEEIERKLKEAEQREEMLLKRITEKDITIEKFKEVISGYDDSIRELLKDKEEMTENYQRQLNEIKADRDSNYHHLASLETTFSDLHVKYEKSKEMTASLKSNEDILLNEKRQMQENLRQQEQRYEKMKNHAMQQLEIANKKLETLTKEHSLEATKLKALLKKEEISRASINEQLQQKTRENAELMKICDELINQGS